MKRPLPEIICELCNVLLIYKNRKSHLNAIRLGTKFCRSCTQKTYVHSKHTLKHKKYMSELMTGREITWKEKIKKSHWSKNENLKKQITEAHSTYMSDLISNGLLTPSSNKNFKCGYYKRKNNELEYFRSSYECIRMTQLDSDPLVKKWTSKHGIKIPYFIESKRHYYIPDFLIEFTDGSIVLEEVKGWINEPIRHQLKSNAAIKFCKSQNWTYKLNFMK